jgi:seryl-tRNA synthetase
MLDIKFIRENPELVRTAAARKNTDLDLDGLLRLDKERRENILEVEKLKQQLNTASAEIAKRKKAGENAAAAIAAMKAVSEQIGGMDARLREIESALQAKLLWVPNVPDESVPVGDESNNVTIRTWGEKPAFSFTPAPHWELGEKLGMLDLARGAKISGSGYFVLTGRGARLQRALINFMIDRHVREGYTEIRPPYLVTTQTMTGTGQLPKLADDMYKLGEEDMYLIPTGEVPVTNLHAGETLKAEALPLKYVSYTPCFRREAGAHGKDTRGMMRVHQFDKVELVKIVQPESSFAELELLTADAEDILQALELPYRVRMLATGDLSFAATKCYDLEVWSAGVDNHLEVSSCSNFLDFQARRMNTRYRPAPKEKLRFVHTLNGSGLALPRTMIALLENHQTARGTIRIPEKLRPYFGGEDEIG